ncbi:type II secretion system F family protein [Sediminivirga luteola]|uniref:Type II secretion system protein F n=1 Tax=Sediminivirga luteola TaxID=1774748 RepID=A0A8J2TY77_9MICO|nr:type II secretion system F family protein [Sediminivirga luteola]GGA14983.1 type II secretion system protein F [Sediminivirga luteola]
MTGLDFTESAALLGLFTGLGVFLLWWSCWDDPPRRRRQSRLDRQIRETLHRAGLPGARISVLAASSAGLALLIFATAFAFTGSWAPAACFACFAAAAPALLIRQRARSRQREAREQWPEAIDHLASGIRAGLSLPEAVMALAERGPEELREHFAYFTRQYRGTGNFAASMRALKEHCADPVADRVAEALVLTRHVGGTEVGVVLRALAEFVRAENRVRAELQARQQWTVVGARLAVAAPWVVLAMLSLRPENAAAYSSAAGATMLLTGLLVSVCAYWLMRRIGRLPEEPRVLR